jgi:hypothetical protein
MNDEAKPSEAQRLGEDKKKGRDSDAPASLPLALGLDDLAGLEDLQRCNRLGKGVQGMRRMKDVRATGAGRGGLGGQAPHATRQQSRPSSTSSRHHSALKEALCARRNVHRSTESRESDEEG